MKHLFVSYEVARQLKEKGFDETCLAWWNEDERELYEIGDIVSNSDDWLDTGKENCAAPLYQQVIDWFREKHKIHIAVSSFPIYSDTYGTQVCRGGRVTGGWQPFQGKTYYEALNKAVEEALKLI